MDKSVQLYKREGSNYLPIFPLALLQSITDNESGKALADILTSYNHMYVPFVNNIYETLTAIPVSFRRKGLWITYEQDNKIYTYEFALSTAEAVDDALWGDITNWEETFPSNIEDGSITLAKFSQELIDSLVEGGQVINNPDEEDLTQNHGLIKFKNRVVDESHQITKGYKILRRELSFAEQVINANTIYEIKYDFSLSTNTVNIPTGCILKFNGGMIKNGTIVGNNTIIEGNIRYQNLILSGTFANYGNASTRPTENLIIGQRYFDINIGPIYWTGTAWVDAFGVNITTVNFRRGTTEERDTLLLNLNNKGFQFYNESISGWQTWDGASWSS